jgi:hypothetical protein
MHDIKSYTQLAEATAAMMRACAFATARAASTPMFQGMSFWSWMLRSSTAPVLPSAWAMQSRMSWNPIESWAAWSRACMPMPNAQTEQAQGSAEPPTDAAVSSYRSSSGHAVAQVIVA